MKNYWIYFTASLLSLIGSNYFIFTQGWYLLKLTQERTSVGITWSLFFLPSLLFLPLIGRCLDSNHLKKVILGCEIVKLILFLVFSFVLNMAPSKSAVYLMAVLYGIVFAPYYASVYVVVKRLVAPEHQTKYSHFFEISLQLANIIAVLTSGFIFEHFGFTRLLLLSASFITLGLIGMPCVSFGEIGTKSISLFSGYHEIVRMLRTPMNQNNLTGKQFLFGILHTFPQSIILVGNVALTLYVFDIMRQGASTFGVIDSLIGVAALFASIFWVKFHKLSEQTGTILLISVLAGVAVVGLAFVSPRGIWPYAWMLVYGACLISSKILARAHIVCLLPQEKIGMFSTFFQTIGYAVMMSLFCVVSAVSNSMGAKGLFILLGGLLLIYSGILSMLFFERKESLVTEFSAGDPR